MTILTTLFNLLLGRGLKYRQVWQIGLHTITVTDTITKLSALVFAGSVAPIYNFAFLGITFIALLGIKPAIKKEVRN
jgi:hypothetical protein